jgi:aspartyl-tRNA(Asn)/glutamyl-tRNA(Gln) amidotransferase subunit C
MFRTGPVRSFKFPIAKLRLAGGSILAIKAGMQAPTLDVRYVAQLARLDLTDEEVALFGSQLVNVLEYAAKLDALDLDGIEPTAHAEAVHNVMRPDESKPGLTPAQALANAPAAAGNEFVVVRVVE